MPTILSQADELDAVLAVSLATSGDIFKMHTDMRIALRRLHDMNESLFVKSHIVIPESFIRARLIKGMRGIPMYETYLGRLMSMTPDEWSDLLVSDIFKHLELVSANTRDLGLLSRDANPTSNYNPMSPKDDAVANVVKMHTKTAPCYDFLNKTCKRGTECRFSHDSQPKSARRCVRPILPFA